MFNSSSVFTFGARVTTVSSIDKVSELSTGTDHSAVSHSL